MRKIIYTVSIAVAIVSCSKESANVPQREFTLEASMPGTDTKTMLGAKSAGAYPVLWASGDVITVNGVVSKPLASGDAGAKTAVFSFAGDVSTPFNVLFGASAGRSDAVEISQKQSCTPGTVCGGPMYAVATSTSFTMQHSCAIITLPVTGTGDIRGIRLSSLDGTAVAGTFRMEKISGSFSGKMITEIPSSYIDLSLSGGKMTLSASPKTVSFAVAPSTQEKGICIEMVASDGSIMCKNALVGETLVAGTVYELPSTAFVPNSEPVEIISSYSELKDFAARVAAGELLLRARLGANITGDATWTPMEGFKGDFDGGGFKISGLRKAFTNELIGMVRNLTLESDITLSSAEDYVGDENNSWAGIVANRLYTNASVINCTTKGAITVNNQLGKEIRIGAVAGYAARGIVNGCVNEATITVYGDNSGKDINAGGFIGRMYSSETEIKLYGNINRGTVLIGGTVKNVYVGGAVGRCNAPHILTIKDNINIGNITIDGGTVVSGSMNVGGIAGQALDAFSGCANYGAVTLSASTSQTQNVGGIVGAVTTDSISECINAGTILMDGTSSGVVRCGGIVGNASGDASLNEITLTNCSFSGLITIDIASHSTLYTNAFTGLYTTGDHTETGCKNSGNIIVK